MMDNDAKLEGMEEGRFGTVVFVLDKCSATDPMEAFAHGEVGAHVDLVLHFLRQSLDARCEVTLGMFGVWLCLEQLDCGVVRRLQPV